MTASGVTPDTRQDSTDPAPSPGFHANLKMICEYKKLKQDRRNIDRVTGIQKDKGLEKMLHASIHGHKKPPALALPGGTREPDGQ